MNDADDNSGPDTGPLPAEKRRKIEQILDIFREIDRATAAFQSRSGLRCLPGCGECCHNKFVAASTLEMLPLAAHLERAGGLDDWMERAARGNAQSPCVFFAPQGPKGNGACRVYRFRPLVCRLYGFCARENKRRQHELMVCPKIRQAYPPEYEQAERDVAAAGKAPVSQHYVMKAYGISPQLAGDTTNINHSFVKAGEMVRFYRHFFDHNNRREVTTTMANKNFPKNSNKNKKPAAAAKGQPAQGKAKSGCC